MTANMPFLNRLLNAFSGSTRLSISAAEGGAANTTASAAATSSFPANAQKCTIAAGCFWGVEHIFVRQFKGKGLLDARVGYIGGAVKSPSYRAVCSGATGHAEALQVTFDPDQLSYSTLIQLLYKMHDPTTLNRQGGDAGTQYRSAIFYHDDEQERVAREITAKAQEQWWRNGKITTEISPAGQWWDAEEYHQKYLAEKNPGGYECPAHFIRNFPDLK